MPVDFPDYRHPALDRFAKLAADYCQVFDQPTLPPPEILLGRVHGLLPQLYAAALALPPTGVLFMTEDSGEELDLATQPGLEADPDRGDPDVWMTAFRALSQHLGPANSYREIFDPYEPPAELEVTGSLADDLLDIERDLRTGLRKWVRGETGEALWEWRFGFECHWGEHATGALRALHARCDSYDLPWPPSPDGAA